MMAERERSAHVHGPDCAHGEPRQEPIRRAEPKVGRNDPCPCGSGRKLKKCHGSPNAEAPPPRR